MRRMNQSSRHGCPCQCGNTRSAMGEMPSETVSDCCGGTMNVYRMGSTPWYPCAPGTMAADILSARNNDCGCSRKNDCDNSYPEVAGGNDCGCVCSDSGNSGCNGWSDLRNAVERCEAAAREACKAAKEACEAAKEAREAAHEACEAAKEANQASCDAQESACESRASAEKAECAACKACECAEASCNNGCRGGNGRNNSCR